MIDDNGNLILVEETADNTETKKAVNYGMLYLGILLMTATDTHDIGKALGEKGHTLTGLHEFLKKNLKERNTDGVAEQIRAYLATDPKAEAEAAEKAKAEREAKRAAAKAAKEAKAKKAEESVMELFGWNA